MLDLVVHLSGKSGSGKDLYANALNIIFNEHYMKTGTVPTHDLDYCSHILAFGESLKYLGADLTGFAENLFFDRATKDAILDDSVVKEALYSIFKEALYSVGFHNQTSWRGKTLVDIRTGLTGCRSIPVEVDVQKFYRWLFDNYRVNPITPRDILKKLGSDGDVVPSWTWVIAVRTQLEYLHASLFPHVAIISDTRRIEELVNTDSWCETRDIKVVRFRINPWKTENLENEHITETELENRTDIRWTEVFSPKEGMAGIVDTLSSMMANVVPYIQFRNTALRDRISEKEYLAGVVERAAAELV